MQKILTKMQLHGTDHVIIGRGETAEGVVSKSDLTGAVSPYLRPVFAKWRRPLDDATLRIKLKWIMSRPVHVASLQASVAAIVANMCRFRVRCLPVVDPQGKVQGLVAEVNIFKALLKLKSSPNVPASGGAGQGQPTSPHSPQSESTQPAETMENPSPVSPVA